MLIVATALDAELIGLLLASSALALQAPEISNVDPQAVPFGTVPVTVTVIDADALSLIEKPLQAIV